MAYTITDFGPDDLLSSDFEGVRRVKTASMSAADVASMNGKLYSFSVPYTIAPSQSLTYNMDLSGKVIIYEIEADGANIAVNNQHATGVQSDISQTHSLNLSRPNGFLAYLQKIINPTLNGNTVVACSSPCYPSVVADGSNELSIKLSNAGSESISGFMMIKLESIGDYIAPFGIAGSDLLAPDTEMSIYG